ncbi:MAG: RIP metalloprotease RseP [Hyphomicrobium sp.]|nr:RIP metalloprotease RseP [Hyphomicrobium sp.]PPC82597.1 MAG: RIP metalloprotease RseP [Hyphomicrobium sp.]
MAILTNTLLGTVWGYLMFPLAFLFVLTIVVFVHEMGHFLVARWCGVKVQAFSIGFGKEIWGFNDRHGTRWRLAMIPLGGYVKFMDDENAASVPSHEAISNMSPEQRAGSFHAKPLWQRAAVVAAGPIANFIMAIAIFAVIYSITGVRLTEARVDEVIADTPAARVGFKPGDVIVAIDGSAISGFSELQRLVGTSPGRKLTFTVKRDGKLMDLSAIPEVREDPGDVTGMSRRVVIGIKGVRRPQEVGTRSVGPIEAVGLGISETKFIITSTLSYLGDVIAGRQKADQLGGPIRIAEVSGQVAKVGIEALIHLVAVLSVSVGLINLFPIPLLDGGHLMFYAIEAVRGRSLSERSQEIGFRIGLAVVLSLMVFATLNDLPILKRWLSWLG